MTAKERTVLRACIKALQGDIMQVDAFRPSYGLSLFNNKPTKDKVAELLKALIDADS